MSKAKAIGTKLKLGTVIVGGIKSIGGIEVTAEAIDVTALDNQDGYREKLPGLIPCWRAFAGLAPCWVCG